MATQRLSWVKHMSWTWEEEIEMSRDRGRRLEPSDNDVPLLEGFQ